MSGRAGNSGIKSLNSVFSEVRSADNVLANVEASTSKPANIESFAASSFFAKPLNASLAPAKFGVVKLAILISSYGEVGRVKSVQSFALVLDGSLLQA